MLERPDATTDPSDAPRRALLEEHDRLAVELERLLQGARAGDAKDLGPAWRELEGHLRAHLRAEETELFSEFAGTHPDEVGALRREHAEIRALLDSVGFGVELHTTRLLLLEDLANRLREHAGREAATLYRFAAAEPGLFARAWARLSRTGTVLL